MELTYQKIKSKQLNIILIVLCICVLYITVAIMFNRQSYVPSKRDLGVLDLSDWHAEEHGLVELNEGWEFYWQKLLSPSDFQNTSLLNPEGYFSISRGWHEYNVDGAKLPQFGYGTYRLRIQLKENESMLGLKIMDVRSAYNLWIDNEQMLSVGRVGTNKSSTDPEVEPQTVYFQPESNEFEILIQVSDFEYIERSSRPNIMLGTSENINAETVKSLTKYLILLGSFLIMGVYHLMLYVFRRKEKSTLYYALFSFLIALRTVFFGEKLISGIIEIPYKLEMQIRTLILTLTFIVLLHFFSTLYANVINRKINQLFVSVFAILTTLIIILSNDYIVVLFFERLYMYVQILFGIYMINVVIKAYVKKCHGANLIIFGILFMFLTMLADLFMSRDYFMPLGLLTFVFLNAVVLASKFNNAFTQVELLSGELSVKREELEAYNKSLEDEVDARTEDLRERNTAIQSLLNHSDQGFLTFKEDLIIGDEYSEKCLEIFDSEIDKNIITDVFKLDKDEKQFFESLVEKIIKEESSFKRDVFVSLLPKDFYINNKNILAEYKVIEDRDLKIMVILTDITDKKELESEITKERNRLTSVIQITNNKTHIKKSLKKFYKLWQSVLDDNYMDHTQNKAISLLREIHTFKGTFAQMGLIKVSEKLNDIEIMIKGFLNRYSEDYNDTIIKIFDMQIKKLSLDVIKSWVDEDINTAKYYLGEDILSNSENQIMVSEKQIKKFEEKIIALQIPNSEKDKILRQVLKLSYKSLKELVKPYKRYVESTAKKYNKRIKFKIVENNKVEINPDIYDGFLKSLVHIFNNMIDHGIETAEERIEHEKEEVGKIQCVISQLENKMIEIVLRDDGRGIDISKLKEKALDLEIIKKGQDITENQLIDIIFKDGFSTLDKDSGISGKGVGLAALKKQIDILGGNIKVTYEAGKGTCFLILLPIIEV
ncbi:7TM diverse intracellular signaling domain-containing protein [Serpentinicella sp. ANB-PHB4]|uniref:7TM diverse intracellular signaling domain-containing protein n=1 Tax=Serpentinicella sp. ANB-PHB4 TaxID=3074076 RepID=UPI002865DE81|nr:7TM diverse intracellular signaling domain-containing protein [Serpentinicella sp. ANB-PHB4]MDR5659384.1 7TM diverse intracellular signaling domain-containing protein [Serpentinicella sp. ANB-PHB4]